MKRKTWLIIGLSVVAAGILLIGCVLGINGYVVGSSRGQIVTAEQAAEFDADCILVLGCAVRDDGSPSAMLQDRLEQGIALYCAGAAAKLLMSGDNGQVDYDEVNTMKSYAIAAGVPSSDIFMDHAGFSTYESLYRAKAIFGAERVIIVTQEYHLYRALYIARQLGIEAVGVAADGRSYAGQAYREVREILARDKDLVQCIFKPEPTYLGEQIPISGDGDVTNDR